MRLGAKGWWVSEAYIPVKVTVGLWWWGGEQMVWEERVIGDGIEERLEVIWVEVEMEGMDHPIQ